MSGERMLCERVWSCHNINCEKMSCSDDDWYTDFSPFYSVSVIFRNRGVREGVGTQLGER